MYSNLKIQNYYAFEWGDILFITLDMFRYSALSADDEEMKINSQNYFFESNHFTLIINFKMINFLMTKNLFNSFRNLINHQANRMKESYLLPKFFSFFMNLFKY